MHQVVKVNTEMEDLSQTDNDLQIRGGNLNEYVNMIGTYIKKYKVALLIAVILVLSTIIFVTRHPRVFLLESSTYCRWKFDYYEASEYEKFWLNNIKSYQDSVCEKLQEQPHLKNSQSIIQDVEDLKSIDESVKWDAVDSFERKKLQKSYELMSRLYYKRECYDPLEQYWMKATGKGVQLIEPLWGFLRDPFDFYCEKLYKQSEDWKGEPGQSKEHIMPQGFAPYAYTLDDGSTIPADQWRTHGIPPWHTSLDIAKQSLRKDVYETPKKIFLDLGSSYFRFWGNEENKNAASGLWFYNHYHARGQKFDRFTQVEVDSLDPYKAWNQLPDDLVGAYALMNFPLEVNSSSKFDVANLIKSYIKPNDFFVIKVDIDSAPIEEPFVYSLLEADGVAEYIDEMMFEHHVDINIMHAPWGTGLPHNMDDSFKLFTGLRSKGIRAHSWP